jgi:photosystem II stability/assembly factor-like uncharacterized protein
MMFQGWRKVAMAGAVLASLAACGGGGGSGGSGLDANSANARQSEAPKLMAISSSVERAWPSLSVTFTTKCVAYGKPSYRWRFGDGSEVETTSAPEVVHVFRESSEAARRVTVTCTDEQGRSTEASKDIIVASASYASVADLACGTGKPGEGWCRQLPANAWPTIVSGAALDRFVQFGVSSGRLLKSMDSGKTWLPVPLPVTQSVSRLSTFVNQTAWLVGAAGTILKTSDGGKTWEAQTSGSNQPISDVVAIDNNRAWALAGSLVLRTIDGGTTWAKVYTNTDSVSITAFTAADAQSAWLGRGNHVLRTSDGGKTWVSQQVMAGGRISGLSAGSNQVVWAKYLDTVCLSEDGGATWSVSMSLPAQWASGTVNLIRAASTETAWLVGMSIPDDVSSAQGIVWVTRDRGRTWVPLNGTAEPSLNELVRLGADTIWVYGKHIGYTLSPAGLTRLADNAVEFNAMTVIHAVDEQVAWASSNKAPILTTHDGGKAWLTNGGVFTFPFKDISATSALDAWSIASGGLIHTGDGQHWQSVPVPSRGLSATTATDSGPPINSVHALTSNLTWASGPAGTIVKTQDSGATWTWQNVQGSTQTFYMIRATDSQRAWALGVPPGMLNSPSTLWRTTDGLNWASVEPPGVNALGLASMSVPSANVVALLRSPSSSGQVVILSVDGGTSWQTLTLPSTDSPYGNLVATDASHLWVLGSKSIWHSDDGGLNWRAQSLVEDTPLSISAVNNKVLWVVGKSGAIYKTITGGD